MFNRKNSAYIYIYIYIEPEVIYIGFIYQIIKIILRKEGYPKRHFLEKVATRKNKKLAYLKKIIYLHLKKNPAVFYLPSKQCFLCQTLNTSDLWLRKLLVDSFQAVRMFLVFSFLIEFFS